MDIKQTKNIWIGIIVIALVAGAYYFGTASKNNTEQTTILPTQETSTPVPTPKEVQVTPTQTKTTTADNLTTASKNGLACKNIANQAAVADQTSSGQLTTVLQTHFSKSLNNCYYELFSSFNGGSQTTIKSAPDDDWIAYCADTGSSQLGIYCGMHNVPGRFTEEQFHQLEQQYLTN